MPVIAVDKPLNLTSHDVVDRVRRARRTRRVGHTGTLDPLATGVLVLAVDASTKLVQFMEADSKDYLAWVALGASTVTLDAEGPVDMTAPVPELDTDMVRAALSALTGPQQQVPPQYSAIQVGGQRAYAVARAGGALDLPARSVVIHDLDLLGVFPSVQAAPKVFSPTPDGWAPDATGRTFTLPAALGEHPTLLIRARVGSGTYLRSLARDLGAALGVPAHLAGLVRTRVGRHGLDTAVPLDAVADATGLGDLDALEYPRTEVDALTAQQLRQGKRPAHPALGRHVVTHGGALVAVVDADGHTLKVVRAWAE
ncbi:tRNA pseudouridine55 synthase [Deinococcus metalli]|uniref:tRNA pseudouridine synthase B n=1 Tax=Deinococcus metalli TaxID=1141878 RepID=A0A7W8NQW4_9DEIO|nr:tRNA pseudouridine(55) synthase TruB [Deinococcus metalli]MBB5378291.1 tRNA pseudouridine55 synthase [Deinococcus metalli]GHF57463.1 tRNA pseudouridine synthase B [Deinococcus metalli]